MQKNILCFLLSFLLIASTTQAQQTEQKPGKRLAKYVVLISQGIVVPKMGLEDIAPVITALLGLSFNAPDGILMPGIIKSSGRGEGRPVINGNINAAPANN